MSRRAALAWLLVVGIAAVGLIVAQRQGVPIGLWTTRVETVDVGSRTLRLVVTSERSRGLMGLDDLGELDGMLFAFPRPVNPPAGMWMRDVRFPLDVAFFNAEGRFLETQTMALCGATCPVHAPGEPFRYAIEAQAGELEWLRPGDALRPP